LCTALLAFAVFKLIPGLQETSALGKAVVIGAITTEVLTFHEYKHVPPASTISLAMFLYLYAAETADGYH
jgi:hypothetical protein